MFCSRCGEENINKANYCKSCGMHFTYNEKDDDSLIPKNSLIRKITKSLVLLNIYIHAICVFIAGVVIVSISLIFPFINQLKIDFSYVLCEVCLIVFGVLLILYAICICCLDLDTIE